MSTKMKRMTCPITFNYKQSHEIIILWQKKNKKTHNSYCCSHFFFFFFILCKHLQ